MRGRQEPQVTMLAFVDLEERVPADHPLRADQGLAGYLVGTAYNLAPMARLMTAETPAPPKRCWPRKQGPRGRDLPPKNWSKSDVSLGPQRRAKWPEGDTRLSR